LKQKLQDADEKARREELAQEAKKAASELAKKHA
jgi:hypothetical protein